MGTYKKEPQSLSIPPAADAHTKTKYKRTETKKTNEQSGQRLTTMVASVHQNMRHTITTVSYE